VTGNPTAHFTVSFTRSGRPQEPTATATPSSRRVARRFALAYAAKEAGAKTLRRI
jgi:hypothetical protein